jgi:glycosyltransferase involved in cell wall biosynthesis
MNKITNPLYLPLTKIVTKLLTHVSVEFAVDYERLKSLGVFPKVYHISNSFALPDGYEKLSKAVKENIILHITRAGSYQKNTEELLAIVPELLKQYPDWSLYIVGPYTDEIKGSITNIKNNYLYLDKQFRLLGNINSREELEKLYAKSKVLIMTSRWEGYPLALVESRRWGLKVISSKIKRLEEILIGHSNYFTYKSGNIEELLSVVSDALRDDYYFTSGRYNLERSEYSRLNSWSCKIEKIAYDLYNI